jgi:hypothetical protein
MYRQHTAFTHVFPDWLAHRIAFAFYEPNAFHKP